MKNRPIKAVLLLLAGLLATGAPLHAQSNTNSWVGLTDGKWETPANWLLGAPGLTDYLDNFTNAGTKTITIDAITTGSFTNTLTVSNLTISAPSSSVNTLLLNNAGTNTPLHVIDNLTVLPGGALTISNSALTVDNGVIPVTLPNGSAVQFDGIVTVNNSTLNTSNALDTTLGVTETGFGPGTLNMTNSVFTPDEFIVGSFSDGTATIVNSTSILNGGLDIANVGGYTGTLNVIGGQFISTNGGPFHSPVIVGDRGNGVLVVSNANVQFNDTVVGNIIGSIGSIIMQSGTMSMGKTYLGDNAEGETVLPYANGSIVLSNGSLSMPELHIGYQATGSVTVVTGFLTSPVVTVAETTNATGSSLTISGGTNLISGSLTVGSSNSSGQVYLSSGALFVTNALGSGILTLNGSSLTHSGGILQPDNLILTNGGRLITVSNFVIGSTNGVTNTATITSGSMVTVSNAVFGVGNDGTTNNGTGSGMVIVTNGTLNASTLNLGSTAGGSGTLTLQSNGVVNIASNLTVVGSSLTSTSSIVVAGGNLSITNGSLLLGTAGMGVMTISSGSTVTVQAMILGSTSPSSDGSLTISGGSLHITSLLSINSVHSFVSDTTGDVVLDNGGNTIVGEDNDGAMTISNPSAHLSLSNLFIAYAPSNVQPGVRGFYTQSAGQTIVTNEMIVGSCVTNGLGTTGFVTLSGATTFYVTNSTHTAALVVQNGTFVLAAGATLVADNLIITNACAQFQNNGGTLMAANITLDSNLDADGDGISNGAEAAAGTDPLNPASYFRILGATKSGNDTLVSWTTVGGHSYYLQSSASTTGIAGAGFTNVSQLISISGTGEGTTNYLHVNGGTNEARFYRVKLGP